MKYYIKNMNDFSKEQQEEFLLFLDKEKKLEFLTASNENRKKSILLSQGFAKETISKEFEIDKKDLIFSVTESGKPYCKSHPEIHFSLSHSGDLLALAISDKEIGIDIEKLRTAKEALITRVCSKNEINKINSSENKDKTFTEIWTKKEAYLKALGTGIDRELSGIDTTDEKFNFFTEDFEDFIVSVFCL